MKNLLFAAAIGDISGVPYEFEGRTKDYESINLLNPGNTYSDDTVCTFACAEALLDGKDMAYAHYKSMPEELIQNARTKLPLWMLELSERFDAACRQ